MDFYEFEEIEREYIIKLKDSVNSRYYNFE